MVEVCQMKLRKTRIKGLPRTKGSFINGRDAATHRRMSSISGQYFVNKTKNIKNITLPFNEGKGNFCRLPMSAGFCVGVQVWRTKENIET
jgi:hypothetical protein